MKKILISGFTIIALSLSLGAASVFAAVVGTNGGFEAGTASGNFSTLLVGDTSIDSWSVASGSVDYINGYWPASEGIRSIDLNGLEAGSVSQTLSTVVGATYAVTFDLSGNPDSRSDQNDPYYSPSNKVVSVDATGAQTGTFNFDTAVENNTLSSMGWKSQAYSFVATGTSTVLTFSSAIPGAFGPAIDNVVITETLPTPAPVCGEDTASNHGKYVSCIAKTTPSGPGKGAIVSAAAKSAVGKK